MQMQRQDDHEVLLGALALLGTVRSNDGNVSLLLLEAETAIRKACDRIRNAADQRRTTE